jgi:hypothetical protein
MHAQIFLPVPSLSLPRKREREATECAAMVWFTEDECV